MIKREKYTTKKQLEVLVDAMKKNRDIAGGFTQRPPNEVNKFWCELTLKINCYGPPMKEISGWKKVWTDFKSGIKKKLAKNKEFIRGTGGGPFKEVMLSALEEEVSQLISLQTTVHGISNVRSFGIPTMSTPSAAETQPTPLEIPLTETVNADSNNTNNTHLKEQETGPTIATTPPPPKRIRLDNTNTLLEQQINIQKQLAEKVESALQEISGQCKENSCIIKAMEKSICKISAEKEKQTKILEQQLQEQKRHNEEMMKIIKYGFKKTE